MQFELLSQIRDVSVIAAGSGVRDRQRLNRSYGVGRWRKLKGRARVRLIDFDQMVDAEVHWYEAHGIGKRELKVKAW